MFAVFYFSSQLNHQIALEEAESDIREKVKEEYEDLVQQLDAEIELQRKKLGDYKGLVYKDLQKCLDEVGCYALCVWLVWYDLNGLCIRLSSSTCVQIKSDPSLLPKKLAEAESLLKSHSSAPLETSIDALASRSRSGSVASKSGSNGDATTLETQVLDDSAPRLPFPACHLLALRFIPTSM